MESEKILIEVFNGISGGCCSCSGCGADSGCGPQVSPEESAADLAKSLKESYGDKIEVKYTDTSSEGLGDYATLNKLVQMGYSFPFVFIQGEPRMAGGIDVEQIKSLLNEPAPQA